MESEDCSSLVGQGNKRLKSNTTNLLSNQNKMEVVGCLTPRVTIYLRQGLSKKFRVTSGLIFHTYLRFVLIFRTFLFYATITI